MLGIVLSAISMTVAAIHIAHVPSCVFWAGAYLALVVTSARIWYKEYRTAGPRIDLECLRARNKDEEFILDNRSAEDAFDVKIQDISRGQYGHASFDSVKVRAHEKVSVKATVHKIPAGSLIFQSRLADFILETADTPSLGAAFRGTDFPLSVEYRNIHGQWYKSDFKVVFFPHKPEVTVSFVSYRRVFKSFLAIP